MISNLIDKRDKVRTILEKEGLSYRAGIIGQSICLIKKKDAKPIDKKIMTKINKVVSGTEIKIMDEYSS